MNPPTPHKFQPGHTSPQLGEKKDPVLDSPLVSLAANAGAVVIGVSLVNLKITKGEESEVLPYAWRVLGYGLAVFGIIRGLSDFSRIKQ